MDKEKIIKRIQSAQKTYMKAVDFHAKVGTTKSLKYLNDCERMLNERLTELMGA